MPKHFTSIFTDKKGYSLSQYNVEVCTQEDEIWNDVLSETRRRRNVKLMLREARLEIFLGKYEERTLKFLALKLYTGPHNLYIWGLQIWGVGRVRASLGSASAWRNIKIFGF